MGEGWRRAWGRRAGPLLAVLLGMACGHRVDAPASTADGGGPPAGRGSGQPADQGEAAQGGLSPEEAAALAGPAAPGGRQLNAVGAGRSPRVAVSEDHVFLAWVEEGPAGPAVHLQRSTDGGATFLPAGRLSSGAQRALSVHLAVEAQRVYVLWTREGRDAPRVWMRASTDAGATFGPVQALPVGGVSAVAAANGSLSVAWWEQPAEAGDEEAELRFRTSRDGGRTWGPVLDLNPGREWGDLALLAQGERLWLLWDDKGTHDDPTLFLRESADRGATWGGVLTPAEGARNVWEQRAVLQGERLHLVWSRCAGPGRAPPCHLDLRTQPGGGQPLGPVRTLSQTAQLAFSPDLAVDGEALHVVWLEGTLQQSDLVYRRSPDAGATLLPEQRLTSRPALRLFPRVAAGGGLVSITWGLQREGGGALLLRQAGAQGASPGSVELLGAGPLVRAPEVAATQGRLHAVWEEGEVTTRRVRAWSR